MTIVYVLPKFSVVWSPVHVWENDEANISPAKNGPEKCVESVTTRRRIARFGGNLVGWRIMGLNRN